MSTVTIPDLVVLDMLLSQFRRTMNYFDLCFVPAFI